MKPAAALAALALLAGCGSAQRTAPPRQPRLPHLLAARWRGEADAVAAALADGDGCLARQRAAALQAAVIDAINAHRVSARFQEPLLSAVNELPSRIVCSPAPAPPHGHGRGRGKHGDQGSEGGG